MSGSIIDLDEAQPPLLVKVDGGQIAIDGLTIDDFLYLLRKFPAFMRRMIGMKGDAITAEAIAAEPASDEIIAEVIACANGHQGNEKAVARAKKFRSRDQIMLVNALLERTLGNKDGVGPFVEAAGTLSNWFTIESPGSASEPDSSDSAGALRTSFPMAGPVSESTPPAT